MTKNEIIKNRYPFYDPNIESKDIEINADAVKELMEIYWIDQLKGLISDVECLHPEYILQRMKDEVDNYEKGI